MYGFFARFVPRDGQREAFLELLRWDTQVAREQEPGTLRLDMWENDEEPGVVYVYEVYTDEAAFEVHASHGPVKKFAEIMDTLIESYTVVPLTRSLTSTADG
jgi:(4S)-4-hydroxy-5-phosphonooxypentane-2,3-dione isomerase